MAENEQKEPKEKKKTLSYKHQLFCQKYIELKENGTDAYMEVFGCTKDAARTGASRLLTNANIQEYISDLRRRVLEELGITLTRVMSEKAKIAFSNIGDFFEFKNGYVVLRKDATINREHMAAIREIQEDKNLFGTSYKIKLYDKQKALSEIEVYLGAGQDKGEGPEREYVALWESVKDVQPLIEQAKNDIIESRIKEGTEDEK